MSAGTYRTLADVVLFIHVAFVSFVVGALFAIVLGGLRRWSWVRNPWFRWFHLFCIAIVITQAWLGMVCPLTTFEMYLRKQAGDPTYSGTFIAHWLQKILFFEAAPWVFAVCYTLFGLLVILGWWKFPPCSFGRRSPGNLK